MNIDSMCIATVTDAGAVAHLVNKSYRPEVGSPGWTHESDLVSGKRTNERQVIDTISRKDSFILLGLRGHEVIACVHVEKEGKNCHIGMLAVSPSLQGSGIGKRMLSQAEHFANTNFASETFTMLVLSERLELISFYERRGYQRTDAVMDYPLSAGGGIPKVEGLKIEILKKRPNNRAESDVGDAARSAASASRASSPLTGEL